MSVPAPVPPPQPADPEVAPAAYRRAMGHFATGVTVVTTRVGTFDHAMTASAFTSVSLEPVLVLVCVDKEARFRDAVVESGFWAASILSTSGRRAADWFATKGRPLVGQLDRYPHHRGVTGAALLDGSLAWLECRTRAVYDGGDHDIVLGAVLAAVVRVAVQLADEWASLGGEPVGGPAPARGQDRGRPGARLEHGVPEPCLLVDADEHEHRFQRHGGERAGGHRVVEGADPGGDDRHPGREVTHRAPVRSRVDLGVGRLRRRAGGWHGHRCRPYPRVAPLSLRSVRPGGRCRPGARC